MLGLPCSRSSLSLFLRIALGTPFISGGGARAVAIAQRAKHSLRGPAFLRHACARGGQYRKSPEDNWQTRAIAVLDINDFTARFRSLTNQEMVEGLLEQVHSLSRVAGSKYHAIRSGMLLLA